MIQTLKQNPLILMMRKKIYDNKFANYSNVHLFRGAFDNFEQAIASAPKTKPTGYDNHDSAKLYKERIQKLYSTDYPILFWMEKLKNNITSVFDFGGHIGIHYYAYPTVLDFSNIKEWTVCDVESVCEEGRSYASSHSHKSKLNFVTEISAYEAQDLFLAKGSLQYLEWELHDKLSEIKNKPKYLIINTTPMHPTLRTITVNNIGTSFCPYHIRIEKDFFQGLKNIGYDVVDIWSNDEKACNIAFEPNRSINYYRGAILKLQI
jgi:putative methyltransferase (TIGR04325 family)